MVGHLLVQMSQDECMSGSEFLKAALLLVVIVTSASTHSVTEFLDHAAMGSISNTS